MNYFVGTLAALGLVGCGGAQSVDSSAPPSSAWEAPQDYGFVLDSSCGERDLVGRFRVEVREGQVADARALDESGKSYSRTRLIDGLPTLTDLEAIVQHARDGGADVADIEYGEPDGQPVRVSIDHSADTTDDEECYEVSGYSVSN